MAFRNPPIKITLPDSAQPGQHRIVIGADTPPELAAFGIDEALLFYVTDVNTGVEVGYFWIGTSNRFDGFFDARVLAYGNVTYPTPGVPTSATVADVKTNFQQDMFGQYRITLFKDHPLTVWTNVNFDWTNGFRQFLINGSIQPHGFIDDASDASSTAAIGAETTIFTVPSATYRNGRAFRIVLSGHFNFSAANGLARVKFYRNSTAGQLLTTFFFGCTAGAAGGAPGQYFHGENLFKNNSGSDITDTIVVTLTCFTAGTCQMFSGADTIRRVEVWDHGAAADHALVQQM